MRIFEVSEGPLQPVRSLFGEPTATRESINRGHIQPSSFLFFYTSNN